MKDTINIQEDEIHYTEEEIVEDEEVTSPSSPPLVVPKIFGKSTEIRKQEMRDRLEDIHPQWVEEYMAKNLQYIIDTSIAEWWSKSLQVAIKWLDTIAKLMWYTETNQSYTIKSNIPVVEWEKANSW